MQEKHENKFYLFNLWLKYSKQKQILLDSANQSFCIIVTGAHVDSKICAGLIVRFLFFIDKLVSDEQRTQNSQIRNLALLS